MPTHGSIFVVNIRIPIWEYKKRSMQIRKKVFLQLSTVLKIIGFRFSDSLFISSGSGNKVILILFALKPKHKEGKKIIKTVIDWELYEWSTLFAILSLNNVH